jgi:prepilin-type N-terminal cleavage/methylation domain-containing protein
MTKTRLARPISRRAFSLIELLIVILIIALVTAIVLPALSHARKAARNAATRDLLSQVAASCHAFELSERRLPGYFKEADMGSAENAGRGFTEMENVMFDLAGGVQPADATHPGWYGPRVAGAAFYDTNLVGDQTGAAATNNKLYFTPPTKFFKLQDGSEGGTKVTTVTYHAQDLKDLVDAEGTPILMWRTDPMAVQPVNAATDFALAQSPAGNASPARFYWNSNSAFLSSTSCGAKRIDQTNASLIGSSNMANAVSSLLGVLGNPSSPVNLTPPAGQPILPSAGRGQFVIQAAGSDATFVSKEDKGGKLIPAGGAFTYDLGFPPLSKFTGDPMASFDDIMVAGGGS